jgi:uncharacterized protein YjdB
MKNQLTGTKTGEQKREKTGCRIIVSALVAFATVWLVVTMSGCGAFIVNPTLTTITVTPETPSVTVGSTQQMIATGTYSDSSTKNLTSPATWSSSETDTASVSSAGLVTGVAAGTATITATSGSISGATTVSVTYANLKSIEVTPTNASITSGETQAFVATATLDDGSTAVITDGVTWTSSNTSAATISSSGVATGQSLTSSATTYIMATSGSISSNSALLTVNP